MHSEGNLKTDLWLIPSIILFLTLSIQYNSTERDSNLGHTCLSLLEFETWGLRPLGHQGQLI